MACQEGTLQASRHMVPLTALPPVCSRRFKAFFDELWQLGRREMAHCVATVPIKHSEELPVFPALSPREDAHHILHATLATQALHSTVIEKGGLHPTIELRHKTLGW